MVGLPGQTPRDVENTIRFVYACGGAPHISYFSPISGTGSWPEAVRCTSLPIEDEPLFQNNSVFILKNGAFPKDAIGALKGMAVEMRNLP